jgi:putative Holliday junction resolvase
MPLTVLAMDRNDALLAAVADLVREHGPDTVIMGLPLNMDGTEGPRAELSRAFAESLSNLTGVPVHLHDERLTSFEAEQRMRGTSRREKKERADAVAACVLLESWIESH